MYNNKYFEKDFYSSLFNFDDFSKRSNSSLRFYYDFIRKNHKKIQGDIFEFGVFNGKSLLATAILLKKINSKKKIYGFDTFSGFPSYSKFDQKKQFKNKKFFNKIHYVEHSKFWKLKENLVSKKLSVENISSSLNFSEANLKILKKKIKILKLNNIKIIKGNFKKTIPLFFKKKPNLKIFAMNIDCDLYYSYKFVLENTFDSLNKGSYVHLDEYYSLKFPGPKIFCDIFGKEKKINFKKNDTKKNELNRYFFIKK